MTRRIFASFALTAALLAAHLPAAASELRFYQKTSQATAPITGQVTMRLTIGTNGQTSNVRVIRTSGSQAIDAAAVSWMEKEIMQPVHVNGEPREFSIVKEINFSGNGLQLTMK
ncbi:TonB family protein [Neisseria sp. S1]|uniref:TonB family protein n=1 Tax=Neisseria sp. S1 TaxID=3318354 RepID=UPI003A8A01B8